MYRVEMLPHLEMAFRLRSPQSFGIDPAFNITAPNDKIRSFVKCMKQLWNIFWFMGKIGIHLHDGVGIKHIDGMFHPSYIRSS